MRDVTVSSGKITIRNGLNVCCSSSNPDNLCSNCKSAWEAYSKKNGFRVETKKGEVTVSTETLRAACSTHFPPVPRHSNQSGLETGTYRAKDGSIRCAGCNGVRKEAGTEERTQERTPTPLEAEYLKQVYSMTGGQDPQEIYAGGLYRDLALANARRVIAAQETAKEPMRELPDTWGINNSASKDTTINTLMAQALLAEWVREEFKPQELLELGRVSLGTLEQLSAHGLKASELRASAKRQGYTPNRPMPDTWLISTARHKLAGK